MTGSCKDTRLGLGPWLDKEAIYRGDRLDLIASILGMVGLMFCQVRHVQKSSKKYEAQ